MDEAQHVKKAIDSRGTSGRKKNLPHTQRKAIYPSNGVNKGYIKKALGFDAPTGSRPVEEPYKGFASEKNEGLVDLNNPSIGLITELIKVAESDVSVKKVNLENATQVIVDVLRACSFFEVTDLSWIAYIFASIAHESRFGKALAEETDNFTLFPYEPLFVVGQQECVQAKGVFYKKLQQGKIVLEDLSKLLSDLSKKVKVTDKTILNINEKISTFIDKYKLSPSKEFLEALENLKKKDTSILADITESFLGLVLEGFEEGAASVYLEIKEVKLLAAKVITTDEELEDLKGLITDEQRRIYRARLLYHVVEKLLVRIEKSNELGNTDKGDGGKYKGRGLIHITGKANYGEYSKKITDKNSTYHTALAAMGVRFDDVAKEKLASLLVDDIKIAEENIPVTAVIVVGGMAQDGFVSKSNILRKYEAGNTFQFFNAREIVNRYRRKNQKIVEVDIRLGMKIEKTARAFVEVLKPKQGK